MTYTGPWQDDALPTDYFVDFRDSTAPGTGTSSFTFGWSSQSSAAALTVDQKMRQAWDGTGEFVSQSPISSGSVGPRTATVLPAQGFAGPRSVYEPLWLTMPHPSITLTAGTLTPERGVEIDEMPDVTGVEWEPTSTRTAERILVRAYHAQQTVATGRSVPVKFVDAVGTRYQPAFEAAGVMNSRPTVATLTLASDGFTGVVGEVTIPLAVTASSSFAVSIVDPFTAAQSITGLALGSSCNLFLSVELNYTFAPQRYRLIYAGDPPPTVAAPVATRVTPSLRMLQRGGAGGMSGIPRMVGNPTRRGSVRQGPGSVY